jgi:2-(1,2-epoxy-1,2-dihydrophenyl)acetyl-CoA isomerase
MSDKLLCEVAAGIATVTFNRPEARNAIDPQMMRALTEVALRLEHDAAVRCVIFRGAGEHFMAGGDVKSFVPYLDLAAVDRRRAFEDLIHSVHPGIESIRRMRKPVLAAVRGAAAGFGLSFALACDLIVAADDSFFTTAYIALGTSPDGGGTFFLPRVVGLKKAAELLFLSERIDAPTALQLGLINKVVPAAELDAAAKHWAGRLAAGPTLAYGNAKQLLNASVAAALNDHLNREAVSFADCSTSDDFSAGIRAFLEKRRPEFSGR